MLHFLVQIRDCDIGAIVNRELKQRVRSVSGLTIHRPITKQDVKLAAKLIQMLDNRWNLWQDPAEEKKDKEKEVDGIFTVTVFIILMLYFCIQCAIVAIKL